MLNFYKLLIFPLVNPSNFYNGFCSNESLFKVFNFKPGNSVNKLLVRLIYSRLGKLFYFKSSIYIILLFESCKSFKLGIDSLGTFVI